VRPCDFAILLDPRLTSDFLSTSLIENRTIAGLTPVPHPCRTLLKSVPLLPAKLHSSKIYFRTLAVTTRMSALSLKPAVPTTTFSPSRILTSLRILASVPGTDREKVKSPN
jgi:hypothetical protein